MSKNSQPQTAEMEATVTPQATQMLTSVKLLEEKVCREFDVSLEEVRKGTITIKNTVVEFQQAEKELEDE